MINRMTRKVLVTVAAALLVAPASWAAVTPFSQNFEALGAGDPNALSGVGFQVSGSVFDGNLNPPPPPPVCDPTYGCFKFFYGNFEAPNGGNGFSAIAGGEGGPAQGNQYLNVYNDYNCCSPGQGHQDTTAPFDFVQSNVLQEQIIALADIGTKWTLKFDAKLPSSLGCEATTVSDCIAFIKTIDPNASFATTNLVTFDAQTLSNANWSTHTLSIDLSDPLLNGQILQWGFASTTRQGANTGVYYDNISFAQTDTDVDGVVDTLDNCPVTANTAQTNSDGDNRGDACDNCTLTTNASQLDSNQDGYGNICDADLNNSLLTTSTDFNLLRSVLNQSAGSSALAAAADMNGSGLVTSTDFNLLRARLNTAPGPSGLACRWTVGVPPNPAPPPCPSP